MGLSHPLGGTLRLPHSAGRLHWSQKKTYTGLADSPFPPGQGHRGGSRTRTQLCTQAPACTPGLAPRPPGSAACSLLSLQVPSPLPPPSFLPSLSLPFSPSLSLSPSPVAFQSCSLHFCLFLLSTIPVLFIGVSPTVLPSTYLFSLLRSPTLRLFLYSLPRKRTLEHPPPQAEVA